jgi:hypothetical protein
MRSWVLKPIVFAAFATVTLFVALFLGSKSTAAQSGASTAMPDRVVDNKELQKLYLALPVAKLPTPRTSDGHPDLSGFYYNLLNATGKRNADGSVIFGFGATRTDIAAPPRYPEPTEPSYKPEYSAKVKAIVDNQYGSATPEDPNFDCKPSGVPRVSTGPLQIVQTPKLIVILYESNFISETFRLIYMDGRPHPKPEDLEPSYYGDSIGHWEGDTLVVDVIGLNDETWLGGAQGHTEPPAFGEPNNHQIIEKYALIHSDQEHVVERYTRHGDMLVYEATVEDPVMFTKPWVLTPRHLILRPSDDRFLETFCRVESTDKNHLIRPTKEDRFKPQDEQFHPPADTKK